MRKLLVGKVVTSQKQRIDLNELHPETGPSRLEMTVQGEQTATVYLSQREVGILIAALRAWPPVSKE